MFKKSVVLIIFISISIITYSQDIILKGVDSIQIVISKDTSGSKKKIFLEKTELKNKKTKIDTLTVSNGASKNFLKNKRDSSNFINALGKLFNKDSFDIATEQSIFKRLETYEKFTISILDTSTKVNHTGGNASNTDIDLNNNEGSGLDLISIIIIALGILFVIVLLVLLLSKKRRGRQNRNEEKIVEVPEILVSRFDIKTKNKSSNQIANEIINEIEKIEDKVGKKDAELIRLQENSKRYTEELEQKINQLSIELSTERESNKNLSNELAIDRKTLEEIRDNSQKVLTKYYSPLVETINSNEIKDDEKINQLLIRNVFPIAFLSSSLLKKNIKEASKSDELNICLLNGDDVEPIGNVTSNSQFSSCSPLAYYSYRFLKSNEIERLDKVYIQGYKIGE